MEEQAPDMALLVLVLILVTGAITLVGFIVGRMARFRCQYCNAVVTPFRKSPPGIQSAIVTYFDVVEKRQPDTSGIFICPCCQIVYDDFSGEKASRDPDPYYGYKAFCKVCHAIMLNCDPANKDITCVKCKTRYSWHVESRYHLKFLKPHAENLLARCDHMRLDSF